MVVVLRSDGTWVDSIKRDAYEVFDGEKARAYL